MKNPNVVTNTLFASPTLEIIILNKTFPLLRENKSFHVTNKVWEEMTLSHIFSQKKNHLEKLFDQELLKIFFSIVTLHL